MGGSSRRIRLCSGVALSALILVAGANGSAKAEATDAQIKALQAQVEVLARTVKELKEAQTHTAADAQAAVCVCASFSSLTVRASTSTWACSALICASVASAFAEPFAPATRISAESATPEHNRIRRDDPPIFRSPLSFAFIKFRQLLIKIAQKNRTDEGGWRQPRQICTVKL